MKNEKANILVTCEKASQASIFHSPVFKEVFNLEIAYSKNDVLQKLKTNKFSILLMDVFMKEENTFDICKSIKNNYKHNKLYLILYSNIKSDIIEINSFENGADDFLTKPFREGELLEVHVGFDFREGSCQELRGAFRPLSVQLGDILRDEGAVGVSADAERVRHAGSR